MTPLDWVALAAACTGSAIAMGGLFILGALV